MRPIPLALQQKLTQRFLAGADAPKIRLVATQVSTNTLMTETIHEEIPAYGDVTFRQMEGEQDISFAYAFCIDEGIAKVYRRKFPAIMDNEWELQWTYGVASDVAIEYDGTWILDPVTQRYYLQTEEYPYMFAVRQGVLTVQKWDDPETEVELATGVSTIATVKGWANSIDIEQDQGLLIAYIKSGAVYYRAFAMQEDGVAIWEGEKQIDALGSNNSTIAVTRTNDFRLAFLTEQSGTAKMLLTKRNYAGMSVRPETVHAGTLAAMRFFDVVRKQGYERETVTAGVTLPYFLMDEAAGTPNVSIVSATRNNNADRKTVSVTLELSHELYGTPDARMIAETTATAMVGTTATAVTVSRIEYADGALTVHFANPPRRVYQLTVTTPVTHTMSFKKNQEMEWYLNALTATLEPQVTRKDGYDLNETVTARTTAGFEVVDVNRIYGVENETVSVETTATVTLTAASIDPI